MNNLMTKSFTNYIELQKQAMKDLNGGRDLESGGLTAAEEGNLAEFFIEVDVIQSAMSDVAALLLDLQGLHEESKAVHSSKVLRGFRDRADSDMVAILAKANTIKSHLEALDRSNVANRHLSPCFDEGSLIDRTRISVTHGLRAKLREMMNAFHSLRERILAEHKENLRRRYFVATGEVATDEVLDKMLTGRSQVLLLDIKGELDMEVVERQNAVNDLQKSLMRLHQVFLDMAIMVETEEEKLNDIEANMVSAKDYISGGTYQLESASEMKKRNDKCIYVVLVLLSIVILACLIPVFASLCHLGKTDSCFH